MAKYELGQKVRVTNTFTNPLDSDAAVDPDAVYFNVREPSGNITKLTYGVSGITKSATGVYYTDISLDMAGKWYVRCWGTGSAQASEEVMIEVAGHRAV